MEQSEAQAQSEAERGQEALGKLAAGRASLSLVRRIFDARQRLKARASAGRGRARSLHLPSPPLPSPALQDQEDAHKALSDEVAQKTNTWTAARGTDAREPAVVVRDAERLIARCKEDKARCDGKLSTLGDEIRRLADELRQPLHKSADANAKVALVDKEVLGFACKARLAGAVGGQWHAFPPPPPPALLRAGPGAVPRRARHGAAALPQAQDRRHQRDAALALVVDVPGRGHRLHR